MDISGQIIKNINLAAKRKDIMVVEDLGDTKLQTSPMLEYGADEEQDQEQMIAIFALIGRILGTGMDPCIDRVMKDKEGRGILRIWRALLKQLIENSEESGRAAEWVRINISARMEQAHKDLKSKFPCWNEDYTSAALKAINEYDRRVNPGTYDHYMRAFSAILVDEVVLAPLSTPASISYQWAKKLSELYPDNPEYAGAYAYSIMLLEAENNEILQWVNMAFSVSSLVVAFGSLMIAFEGGIAAAAAALILIARSAQNLYDFVYQLLTRGLLPASLTP